MLNAKVVLTKNRMFIAFYLFAYAILDLHYIMSDHNTYNEEKIISV